MNKSYHLNAITFNRIMHAFVPRRKSCVTFVALLVLLSRPLLGAEDYHNGFRIVKERDGDTVILIIKSDYACEFTVTFEANLKNTTASRPCRLRWTPRVAARLSSSG